MRPQGAIRQALASAAAELAAERGPVTWRDMAERAQVGYRVACITVRDMSRAGQLQCAGFEKRAHSRRWMALWEPAPPAQSFVLGSGGPADPLLGPLRGWKART